MLDRTREGPVSQAALLCNDHVVMTRAAFTKVVSVRRTSAPFVSIDEMRDRFGEVNRVLDELGRRELALIVDTRDAPPRNDPAFEDAFAPVRLRLLTGFRKVAVVVSTPIGKLQVERHARQDKLNVRAFLDEQQAKTFCGSP